MTILEPASLTCPICHVNDIAPRHPQNDVNDDVNDIRHNVNDPTNTGGPMSTMMSTTPNAGPLTLDVTPVGGYVNDVPTSTMSTRGKTP